MTTTARNTALAVIGGIFGVAIWFSRADDTAVDLSSGPASRIVVGEGSIRDDAPSSGRPVPDAAPGPSPRGGQVGSASTRRWPAPVTRPAVPEREDGAPPSPQAAGRRDDQGRRIHPEPPDTDAELHVAAAARSAVVAAWPRAQECLRAPPASLVLTVDVDVEGEAFFGGATVPGRELSPGEEQCLDELFADLHPGASPTRPLIVEVPAP